MTYALKSVNDVFEFIEKLYSLQIRISGQKESVQQNMAQKHLNLALNYGTLFQMNVKLLNQWNLVPNECKTTESIADPKVKNENLSPRELPL